jgi:hypothetical protein
MKRHQSLSSKNRKIPQLAKESVSIEMIRGFINIVVWEIRVNGLDSEHLIRLKAIELSFDNLQTLKPHLSREMTYFCNSWLLKPPKTSKAVRVFLS